MDEYKDWLDKNAMARMPIGNLIVALQKLEKDISHFKPEYRAAILRETSRRLNLLNNTVRKPKGD